MEGRHGKKEKRKKERNASKCRTVRRRSEKGTDEAGVKGIVLEPGWCLNQPSRLGHLGPLWVEDRASNGLKRVRG